MRVSSVWHVIALLVTVTLFGVLAITASVSGAQSYAPQISAKGPPGCC